MTRIKSVLPQEKAAQAAKELRGGVAELIDLSLQGKQLHWNLVGPRFRSLHLQLDELVDFFRLNADTLAERMVALGHPADGRLETVTKETALPVLPEGWVQDNKVIGLMMERMETTISNMRRRIDTLGEIDPVTQDIIIGLTAELEKQLWMLQAEHA